MQGYLAQYKPPTLAHIFEELVHSGFASEISLIERNLGIRILLFEFGGKFVRRLLRLRRIEMQCEAGSDSSKLVCNFGGVIQIVQPGCMTTMVP